MGLFIQQITLDASIKDTQTIEMILKSFCCFWIRCHNSCNVRLVLERDFFQRLLAHCLSQWINASILQRSRFIYFLRISLETLKLIKVLKFFISLWQTDDMWLVLLLYNLYGVYMKKRHVNLYFYNIRNQFRQRSEPTICHWWPYWWRLSGPQRSWSWSVGLLQPPWPSYGPCCLPALQTRECQLWERRDRWPQSSHLCPHGWRKLLFWDDLMENQNKMK